MEQPKVISINPNLFAVNKSKSNREKGSKKKLSLKIERPSNIKKELIKKIRNYQNKTKKKKNYPLDNTFNSEFKESIEYLRNVINNDKLSADNKTTPPIISDTNINTNPQRPIAIPPDDIPWGVLKNGKKPTYRKWIRDQTLKSRKYVDDNQTNRYVVQNNPDLEDVSSFQGDIQETPLHIPINTPIDSKIDTTLESRIEDITPPSITIGNNVSSKRKVPKETPRKLKKKTLKKKYTCGKSKTKKQIGIIIKGIETKNKVLREQRDLRNTPIQVIRNFLYKKSFIKVGSTAPDKVLRDMYESIILSGDVNNTNSHILIHNYMNND